MSHETETSRNFKRNIDFSFKIEVVSRINKKAIFWSSCYSFLFIVPRCGFMLWLLLAMQPEVRGVCHLTSLGKHFLPQRHLQRCDCHGQFILAHTACFLRSKVEKKFHLYRATAFKFLFQKSFEGKWLSFKGKCLLFFCTELSYNFRSKRRDQQVYLLSKELCNVLDPLQYYLLHRKDQHFLQFWAGASL